MIDKIKHYLFQNNILIIFSIMFIFFSLTAGSTFLSGQNILNVLRQMSMNVPPALSLLIVLITTGGVDLSVGSVLAMSAALTMSLQPQGVLLSVIVALFFGILVGALNGFLVTKGKVVAFIATLGTMSLVHGIMLTYTRQQPIAGQVESFTFWGAGSIGFIPTPFIIAVILSTIIYIILKYTQFGRDMYAIGGNIDSAYLAGIRVNRVTFFVFVISGLLASISGVLLASRLNASTVQIGGGTALWSIAAAIMGGASMMGGKGSVFGTFIGVLTLAILLNGTNLLGVQTYVQIGLQALILIIVVAIDGFSIMNISKKLEEQAYGNRE